MGVVYEATDPRLKRTVAIKLLPRDLTKDDTAKQRFLQEAQAASALDHPNICTIHEINETDDGQLYLVMARYEGRCGVVWLRERELFAQSGSEVYGDADKENCTRAPGLPKPRRARAWLGAGNVWEVSQ